MKNSSRNPGIDALRIISMLSVVTLHILGHGKVLITSDSLFEFSVLMALKIIALPAVNCFVLISGYVGYKENNIFPKIKNILSLMFTVLFYSITIAVIFKLFTPVHIGTVEFIESFFPTVTGKYWFFSAYFGLFLLSPFLNILVSKSTLKQDIIFLIVFLLLSTISVFNDVFLLSDGYSVIWFILLYLVGAMIKKNNLNKIFSGKTWSIIIVCAFFITWLHNIILHFINIPFLREYSDILVNYVSPTVVLMAIGLFDRFSDMKSISCGKLISFLSVSAFSVYLIHDNPYIRKHIISNIHSILENSNALLTIISVLAFTVSIFCICILIDQIRILLFKMIKADKSAQLADSIIKSKFNILYLKIKYILENSSK